MRKPSFFQFLGVLTLIAFSMLFRLKESGLIPGEPDEFMYKSIAEALPHTLVPFYLGAPFFHNLPLFTFLESLLMPLPMGSFMAGRVISFLATLSLAVLIFFYLRRRYPSELVPFWGSFLFLFNPLTVFYSQVGVIDPLLSLLSFAAFVYFSLFLEGGRWRDSLLAGVFLALSIATKYTAVSFLLFVSLIWVIRMIVGSWKNHELRRRGDFYFDTRGSLVVLIPLLTIGPLVWLFYKSYPVDFKWQFLQSLGVSRYGTFSLWGNLASAEFLTNLAWWLSPTPALASLLGFIFVVLKKGTRELFLIFSFLVMATFVFSRVPYNQRYTLVLVPFLAVFSAFLCGRFFSFLNDRFGKILTVVLVVAYLLIYKNYLTEAYLSSKHNLFESAAKYLRKIDPQGRAWIFSNYWPNIVAGISDHRNYAWLTFDNKEVSIFQGAESRTGKEILNQERSLIVVEELLSPMTIVLTGPRSEALFFVTSRLSPSISFVDSNPNFPFTRKTGNTIAIYETGGRER